jgi:putative peptidoglycan lipid II flippase
MSVARSTMRFAAGTMVSRVLGLVRDKCLAHYFGATNLMDAFQIAFRIPNLFRDMLAEGALNSAFTKVYSQLHGSNPERAKSLLGEALILLGSFAVLFSIAGIFLAPYLVEVMTLFEHEARGPEFAVYTTNLTRLLFPFIGLMIVGALFMGVLHQRGQFFVSGASSSLFNIGYISGAVVFSLWAMTYLPPSWDLIFGDRRILGLGVGVLLGGLGQVAMQGLGVWRVLREECTWKFSLSLSPEFKNILLLMGPIAIAASAAQLNVIVNTNFATGLEPGSVTMLNNAFRLWQLPIAILAVGLGNATLPALARLLTVENTVSGVWPVEAKVKLRQAIQATFWVMIPCFVFMAVNSYEFCSLIYQSGAYSRAATEGTARILTAYSIGLLFYGLVKVLSSAYVAMDRTRYAMLASLVGVGVNFLANALLVQRFGAPGLALTASLVLGLNAGLLLFGLRRYDLQAISGQGLRVLGSVFLAGALSLVLQIWLREWILASTQDWPEILNWSLILLVNGSLVVAFFLVAGAIAYRLTWAQLWKNIKARRRS